MSIDALYPFLRADAPNVDALLFDAQQSTRAKVQEATDLRVGCLERYAEAIDRCAAELAQRFACGATLFAFGNGGSATDAQSVAEMFARGALPALCLSTNSATLTALANDVNIDVVFARQLDAFGHAGDIAVGISTSGNSGNVLAALDIAQARGLLTVAFAGHDGGHMANATCIDHLFVVPSASVHRIQEAQVTLYHRLWERTTETLAEVAPRR